MSLLYILFKYKTRKDLKNDISYLESMLRITKTLSDNKEKKLDWFKYVTNKLMFDVKENETFEFEDYKVLVDTNIGEQLDDNNATLYSGEDGSYLYLSKKLTEGFTHLFIAFVDGKVRFYLNNDGKGLEIDSNNRVKDRSTLTFLMEYFGAKTEKIEIFFEKI